VPDLRRRFVIPGEVVGRGNLRAESNVIRVGDRIVSTRVGMAEVAHDAVRVVPLSGPYIPRVDDLVVGKIIDYSAFAWEADINSCFFGILPAQSVFGRDYSPAKDSLTDRLAVGDMVAAKVIAFDRTRDPLLSISGPGLGRIPRGQTVKISPAKVPRLIGKKGSMIRAIEQGSNTRMLIGQNGIVVVVGASEDVLKAVKAVNLVEEQAHSPDLTERVSRVLGVPMPPVQQASSQDSQTTSRQNSEIETTGQTPQADLENVGSSDSEMNTAESNLQEKREE
jgi:exosome complex component RRP4